MWATHKFREIRIDCDRECITSISLKYFIESLSHVFNLVLRHSNYVLL